MGRISVSVTAKLSGSLASTGVYMKLGRVNSRSEIVVNLLTI
jgi:hypothetical protein